MSFYREQLEQFLKTLDIKAETVIDLGGKQKPIQGRTKSWDVKNYFILDLPDFNLDEPILFSHEADIIFCLETFEYLLQPFVAMKNINNFLKKNGTAYISCPLVYPVHEEREYDSLRFTENGIKRLANANGLNIVNVYYRNAKTKTLVQYYQEDGMRMAKNMNHHIVGYIFKLNKV